MRDFSRTTAIFAVAIAAAGPARAQGVDSAAAESLFRTGRSLMEAKDFVHACPKLAESFRLDPGTGVLLALAVCHEGEGKLATAWGEYSEVIARAKRDARPDREQLAREKMNALETRLPMMTISVAPGGEKIDRLEIKRDGVLIGPGSWGAPVPVDPGHHHVEASAPGRKPFTATVSVGSEGEKKVIVVPALAEEVGPPSLAPVHSHDAAPAASGSSTTPVRTAGIVVGGLGVAGLAVGAIFGLRAIGRNNDSKANCDGDSNCTKAGTEARLDARSAGNVSTVAFAAGGVLAAAGATMFVVGKPRPAATGAVLSATPFASARELGIAVGGAF